MKVVVVVVVVVGGGEGKHNKEQGRTCTVPGPVLPVSFVARAGLFCWSFCMVVLFFFLLFVLFVLFFLFVSSLPPFFS